jgi:hypothetical protein
VRTALVDELKGAILRRDDVARRAETSRSRLAGHEAERQAAEDGAADAAKAYRLALTDVADGGEFIDGQAARANRDASASHAADLREATAGLVDRLAVLERDLEHAKKLAARARKAVAIELATVRETEVRRAAHIFGRALSAFHTVAETANREAYNETGQLGNPVPHEGRASLLVSASDDGIAGILASHGVGSGAAGVGLDLLMQGLRVRARAMTEAELLSESNELELSTTNTTNGAAIALETGPS